MTTTNIPDGFEHFGADDSYNKSIAPLYLNIKDDKLIIGMLLDSSHCNSVGFFHGGASMTLIDVGFSSALGYALGKFISTPTISINFDFMNNAKAGDWVEITIDSLEIKRSIAFVGGTIEGPKGSLVRASACYKLPVDIDTEPGMTLEQYREWRKQQ